VHDALAVYYFPAMDDWDRAIVRPLALQAFQRKMHEQRSNYEKRRPLAAEQRRQFSDHVALGERMLQHFFAWAATLDDFASIFADHEFWAPIPDPDNPGHELVSPEGWPIRYLGRIDQLISNRDDEYWVVAHRLVNAWEDTERFVRDYRGVSYVWAMRLCYPQFRIAGNVYNELRTDTYPAADTRSREAVPIPPERDKRDMRGVRHINRRRDYLSPGDEELTATDDEIVEQTGNDKFRRTYVRRCRATIEQIGAEIAEEARLIDAADLVIAPHHSSDICPTCPYQEPCAALDAGLDVAAVLTARYRQRTEREVEQDDRLRRSAARDDDPSTRSVAFRNVRARWG
jgi:hypothetical protein